MDFGYLRDIVDPGGSGFVRQTNSTPVASQNLPDRDAKMTWVRSTLSEILQSRLKVLGASITDCDQRMLSLDPGRQSRSTWCTNDLHNLLICIYDNYGPTRMKVEGPNSNGLSWIKFYKLFDVEQGRTKRVVHVIWVKPGETLVNRIYDKTNVESEKLNEGLRLPDPPTFSKYTPDVPSSPNPTKELHPELTSAPPTNTNVAPEGANSAAEAPGVNTTLPTATATPQTQPVATATPHKPGTKPVSENGCHIPQIVIDTELGSEIWSEKRDSIWAMKFYQKPPEAKDEEWGVVSCVSMDSMDGSWTLILDEDLTW